MNIIWGYKADPHITAQQLRNTYVGIFGDGVHILDVGSNLAATVISATEVQISDGVMVAQGCTASIENGVSESLVIANGTQGMLRRDLIVAQYTKNSGTGVENVGLAVKTGTPAASNPATPSYTTGSIADGDTLVEFPLYQVNLDGISITSVERLADVVSIIGSIAECEGNIEEAEANMTASLTDYMIRVSINTGAHTCAANTGSINYNYTIPDGTIPTGYKALDVRLATTGGTSNASEFYCWACDFANNDHTVVDIRIQKRSGTGGTLYPWIVITCIKDI